MDSEAWQQVDRLYRAVLERPAAERAAFLNQTCPDPEIRREVESQLGFGGPSWDTQLAAGQRLGPYEIVERVGAGGMGEVWKARDTRLGREVAIKLCAEQFSGRFRSEARAIAALNHPHICTLHDVGPDYLVMELLAGAPLSRRISGKPLAVEEVVEIAIQIADALAAAHGNGIVHRDIKPDNIFVMAHRDDAPVRCKILDFGLAKTEARVAGSVKSEDRTATIAGESLTQGGSVIGTLAYMSPEQALGKEIDQRSDLFSLGVVIYEMATGKRPFTGDSAVAQIDATLHQTPTRANRLNPLVPDELGRIIEKAIEKDRAVRYQHASETLADLKRLKRDTESSAAAIGHSAKRMPAGLIWAAAALVLTLVCAGAYFLAARSGRAIDSLAVLPFVNVGADENTEYLSDGITGSLINSLSQLPRLTVMSRNSVMGYKGRQVDARTAGRELKVQAVLTGRVVQRGDGLNVSVELVDVRDNSHIWGDEYNRKLTDILAIQEDITRDVSDKLRRTLSGEDEKRLAKRPTSNPEAYQLYLKGRYWAEKFTDDGVKKAIDYFHRAIDLDPSYALAYDGLSYTYSVACDDFLLSPRDSMPKAKAAAQKAIDLDETLPEAHVEMAIVDYWYDFTWSAAEKEFRRAIELRPGYGTAHEYYAWFLITVGRPAEGLEENKRAQELDPLSIELNTMVGFNFYQAHRYDQAVDQLRKTLDMDPNYWLARLNLGMSYEAKGDLAQASVECGKALQTESSIPWTLAEVGHVNGLVGKKSEAEQTLRKLEDQSKSGYVPAYNFAEVYLGLGQKEQALASLEKAYADRSMMLTFIKTDPQLDPLRSEPRFRALLSQMGLPQ